MGQEVQRPAREVVGEEAGRGQSLAPNMDMVEAEGVEEEPEGAFGQS